MTKQQAKAIRLLVSGERKYWEAKANGGLAWETDRMLEVGRHAGLDPRTFRSLHEAGIVEGITNDLNQTWARLVGE